MATDIVETARGWIGTPYRHQASLRGAGCDCLGLLRGVWRELHGDEPETAPPYAPDWADAAGEETLRDAFARHLTPVALDAIAPGDVVLFRMVRGSPAKHCGIVAERGGVRTLIHARQNRRVMEEAFSPFWRARLTFAFRI
jgi:NlpC/P60 family putative phage cell wall peptidase